MYFLGLSFRNTAKALSFLLLVKISHVSIWSWLQKYKPKKFHKEKKIQIHHIDETAIKAGSSDLVWLWLVIEPPYKEILSFNISKEAKYIHYQTISVYGHRQVWKTSSFV